MRNVPVRVSENLYRQRKTKVFWARKKINGRPKWHCLETDNGARAKSKLRGWLLALESLNASAVDFKLGALVELYQVSKQRVKGPWPFHLAVFKATFPTGLNFPVDQIRVSHLITWMNEQAKKRKWKSRSWNLYRLMLRDLFAIAEAEGIVTSVSNPFKAHLIKRAKADKIERYRPTQEQFYAIVTEVRRSGQLTKYGDNSADFLQFLGEAGLGQAEVGALTWEKVGESEMQIRRAKTGEHFVVPIYPWLKPLIEKLKAKSEPDYRLVPRSLVFRMKDAKRALDAACKRLGLRHYSQRNLRQFCIARLAEQGVDARQIAKWQGHTDGGVLIQRVYRNCFSDDEKAAEQRNLEKLRAVA